jgi:hypothetical protein
MFLESYKALWILSEDHSFEDRMIDDLSVSRGLEGRVGRGAGSLHIEGYRNGSPWLGQNQGARYGREGL